MSFLVRTSRRPRTFSVKITPNTFKHTTSRVHKRSNFIIGSLLCHLIVIFCDVQNECRRRNVKHMQCFLCDTIDMSWRTLD